MWKYVSRRVKDTIELGINVRKSFTIQENLNNKQDQESQKQQQHDRKQRLHIDNFIAPRYHDPSRDKDKSDEKFKKKYHRLHQSNRCFLNALTWSTALITGFYASQLICLYRRRQRLCFDTSRCVYSKYVLNTTHSLHENVKHLLKYDKKLCVLPTLSRFQCSFQKIKERVTPQTTSDLSKRAFTDEFIKLKHFVEDPGYKKYEQFFGTAHEFPSSSNKSDVHNVSNDIVNQNKHESNEQLFHEQNDLKISNEEEEEDMEEMAIDDAIRQLSFIAGEMEFELGIESINSGDYEAAVDHFKLSSCHNNPSGIFNLALCYERGVGVKKNMRAAKELYEIACSLGHAKAFYNLGVFHAQGLGGTHKNFGKAKRYFEQAAELGNGDAAQALTLLLPPQPSKKFKDNEFSDNGPFFNEKPILSKPVSAIDNNIVRRLAVT